MSLFEVISKIEDIEIIAVGSRIRDLEWLQKTYGSGRWRKLKGIAWIEWLTPEKRGKVERAEKIWFILMFQMWYARWM